MATAWSELPHNNAGLRLPDRSSRSRAGSCLPAREAVDPSGKVRLLPSGQSTSEHCSPHAGAPVRIPLIGAPFHDPLRRSAPRPTPWPSEVEPSSAYGWEPQPRSP